MYRVARAVGFRLDAERAHRLALRLARIRGLFPVRVPEAGPVEVMGLHFRNRVGLAAGYDKDAVSWRGLAALGFGHIEVGTITPLPQPGNPPPRLHRLTDHEALVNGLGFPGRGMESAADGLTRRRPDGLVLGVSIGPNADTPVERRPHDYARLASRLAPLADYLAVNVSSPNTAGLRTLESVRAAADLVARVRDAAGGGVPVAVKLSPDLDDPGEVATAVADAGAAGVIVGNTTTTRPGGVGEGLGGGLSGAPLRPLALRSLDAVVGAPTGLAVIACGGIMSGSDARRALDAGASLVHIYTGLVYRGPALVREILRDTG
jgi:dihydroorotate dehydrogenase